MKPEQDNFEWDSPAKIEHLYAIIGWFSFIASVVAMYNTQQHYDEKDYEYRQRCAKAEVSTSLCWPPG
jgi:hypothetical protein